MDEIVIEPRTAPLCGCGASDWSVGQQVSRESHLIRVDGLADLLVEKPDPLTFAQAVMLICNKCNRSYLPQPGVEAWYEGGGEDGYGFADRVRHDG